MSWRTCVFLSFFANCPCKKHLGVVWWIKNVAVTTRSVEMTQITNCCRTIRRCWGPSVQCWDTSKVHSEKQTWQWNWNTWTLNECVGLPFVETDMKSFCQPVITSIFSQVTCEDRLYPSGSSCSVTCPTGYRTGHHLWLAFWHYKRACADTKVWGINDYISVSRITQPTLIALRIEKTMPSSFLLPIPLFHTYSPYSSNYCEYRSCDNIQKNQGTCRSCCRVFSLIRLEKRKALVKVWTLTSSFSSSSFPRKEGPWLTLCRQPMVAWLRASDMFDMKRSLSSAKSERCGNTLYWWI